MSNKLEQINIRLSEGLKKKITDLAKEKDLKTSDFVRKTLGDALKEKSKENLVEIANFTSRDRIVLQAAAFIAHTDTVRPLVDCLNIALEVAKQQMSTEIADPMKLSREEREKYTLELNSTVAKKLQVSKQALTYIRLLLVTYLGLIYNQDIFQMTPLSMETMKGIKEQLDLKKKFVGTEYNI